MGFIGEYSAKVDAKGRFLLPADIKKQIAEAEQSKFVINRGFEQCLNIYTQENWQPIYNRLTRLNDFNPNEREFKRFFMSGARNVELDLVGRLLIPKDLIAYASVRKEIVMIGTVDKVEVWDKDTYEKLFQSYTPEQYSHIAQKVMGTPPSLEQ